MFAKGHVCLHGRVCLGTRVRENTRGCILWNVYCHAYVPTGVCDHKEAERAQLALEIPAIELEDMCHRIIHVQCPSRATLLNPTAYECSSSQLFSYRSKKRLPLF